ncbi:MAG: protein kinase [Rhodoglobus sp.]
MDLHGGHRIVRKLGEGQRAEVFLAHPQRDEGRVVAIKVYRPGVSDASIATEIEALSRASGEHSLMLRDLTTAPDGAPTLLLERLPGGTLARLLRGRTRLHPGEATTILAPLALALRRLHLAGVVHGAVRQDAVLFDHVGAPVLACFGNAALIAPGQPPASLDAEAGVGIDLHAFANLAGAVLAAVDGPAARDLADWVVASPVPSTDPWLDQLADRLFNLGLPQPVDFTSDPAPAPVPLVPARLVRGAPVAPHEPPSPTFPPWVARLIPHDAAEVIERLRGSLRVVRKRVWVVAGAVVVAFAAALVLVPQGGSAATPQPSASASVAPVIDDGPVTGDDPVVALVALLQARERCIRELSVLCLDSVGQTGSAALAADEALIRSLQAGGESPQPLTVQAAQVTIDERLGGSVILDLDAGDTEPASILLMKGEAGWRIRDYLQQ